MPEAPGRVVTLVPLAGARCWGRAFRVAPASLPYVLERLDHRESGGFARDELWVHAAAGRAQQQASVRAIVYIATHDNPNYLGPAPLAEIADQIARAHGPSGPNVEYLVELATALRAMNAEDEHVFDLAERLRS